MEQKEQAREALKESMYCHQCGAENSADAEACVQCGASKDITGQLGGISGPAIVAHGVSAHGAPMRNVRGGVFVPPLSGRAASSSEPSRMPDQAASRRVTACSMPYVAPMRADSGTSACPVPYVVPIRPKPSEQTCKQTEDTEE